MKVLVVDLTPKQVFQRQIQSKIGGTNVYDHVKRMMQLIISNQQALKYSWHGLKGNRKFKDTITAKLLLSKCPNIFKRVSMESENFSNIYMKSLKPGSYLRKYQS